MSLASETKGKGELLLIDAMAWNCGNLVDWPTHRAIQRNLPQPFKDSAFAKRNTILL